MKLYDVVFTKDNDAGELHYVETSSDKNSKYKSIYLENTKTNQRYFLSKDIIRNIVKGRKDKSKETYPELNKVIYNECTEDTTELSKLDPVITEYTFDNMYNTIDGRNFNIVIGESGDEGHDILSIAIDDNSYQFIDYVAGADIIQTGRRNGFRTCLLDTVVSPDENNLLFSISLYLRDNDDPETIIKYNIFIDKAGVHAFKFDMMFSDPTKYVEFRSMLDSNPKYYKGFKPSDFNGICTEVVLVNTKYIKTDGSGGISIPVIDKSEFVNRSAITTVIPCSVDNLTSAEVEDLINQSVTSKNIRVLTAIGIKTTPEFYRKHKILYMFSYNPKTGLSTCVKAN